MVQEAARGGRAWRWACAALALMSAGSACVANDFPARPIRIIVASGPGGGTDLTGRNVAKTMSEMLGHPVVVENPPARDPLPGRITRPGRLPMATRCS